MATGADTQESVSTTAQTLNMQAEVVDEVETMKTVLQSNVATSEDESFLKSPEVAKVASEETCRLSVQCRAEDIPCQVVKTTTKEEENTQDKAKLEYVEETGKEENELVEETKAAAEKRNVDRVNVNFTGSSLQLTNNEKHENIEDDDSSNLKKINFQQVEEIIEQHVSVEPNPESTEKEARDLETVTEAFNEKESITSFKPIEEEIREMAFNEGKKESDQPSNPASQEKGPDADRSSAAGATDSTGDGFTLPESESPSIQNDELKIGKSVNLDMKEISVLPATDISSIHETEPGKEEKLKKDSTTAVDEKGQGTVESSLIMRSLSQVENDIQDKNLETQRIPDQQVEPTIEEASVEERSKSTGQEASDLQKNGKEKVMDENTDVDPNNIEATSGKKELASIDMIDPAVDNLKEDETLAGEEKCPEAIKQSDRVGHEDGNKEKALYDSTIDGLTLTASENPYTQNDEEAKLEISENEKVETDELPIKQPAVASSTHETGTEESEKLKEVSSITSNEKEKYKVESNIPTRSMSQVEDKKQDMKDLDASAVKETEEICLQGEKSLDIIHSIPEISTIYQETKEEPEDQREVLKEIDQANSTSSRKDREDEDTEQKIKHSLENQDNVQTASNELPATEPSQEKKDDKRSAFVMDKENINSTQIFDNVEHSQRHTEKENIPGNEKLKNSSMVSEEIADAAASDEDAKKITCIIEDTPTKIHEESIEGKGKEDASAFIDAVDGHTTLEDENFPQIEKTEIIEVVQKGEEPDEVANSEPGEVHDANEVSQIEEKHVRDMSEECHREISGISEQTYTESEVAKGLNFEKIAIEMEKPQETYGLNSKEKSGSKEAEESIEETQKEEACNTEIDSITKGKNTERCEENFQVNSHLEEMPVVSSKETSYKADDIDETNSEEKEGQDGNKSVGNLEITMEPSHELIQEEKDETPKNKENDTETPEGVIKENEEDERETEKSKIEKIETGETSESISNETNQTVESSKSTDLEASDLQKNEKEEEAIKENTDTALNKQDLSISEAFSGTEEPSTHTHDLDVDSLKEDDGAVTEDPDKNENIVNAKPTGDEAGKIPFKEVEEKESDSSILAGEESGPEAIKHSEKMGDEEDNEKKTINDSTGDGLTSTSSETPDTHNGEKAKLEISNKVELDELSVRQAVAVSSTHETGPEEGEKFIEVSCTANSEKEQYEMESSVATISLSQVEAGKEEMNNLDVSVVKDTEEICLQEEKMLDIVRSIPEISVVDQDSKEVEQILKGIDQTNFTSSGKERNKEGTEQNIKDSFEKQISMQTVGNELPITEASEEKKYDGRSTAVMVEENIYSEQITDVVEHRDIDTESHNKFPENEKLEISSSTISEETPDVAASSEDVKKGTCIIEETITEIHEESIEGKEKKAISAFPDAVDEHKLLDEKNSPLTEKNETRVLTKGEKPDEVTYSQPEVQEANVVSQEYGKHIDDTSDECQIKDRRMSEKTLTESEVDSETIAMEIEKPQETSKWNSEEKSENKEAEVNIEVTQKEEEACDAETQIIPTEKTQAQDENKSTGNLQVKMEKSHESIKAEVDKIYEKIENNEETPKDLIKENREDEKEIEKLKIETETVEISETSKSTAHEINQTVESLEETLCTSVGKEEESLQTQSENQKEGFQMEKNKSSSTILAEEESTLIGLVEPKEDNKIKTSRHEEDSKQIHFGSEGGQQSPDVMVVAIQTNVEQIPSLKEQGNREENTKNEELEEVYEGCKVIGKEEDTGKPLMKEHSNTDTSSKSTENETTESSEDYKKEEEMSGKEPHEEHEGTGIDKDAEEQMSEESIRKDESTVLKEVKKVEQNTEYETTAAKPPKQEKMDEGMDNFEVSVRETDQEDFLKMETDETELNKQVSSPDLELLDKTEETGLIEETLKSRQQPSDDPYLPDIANAPEETTEELNGDNIKNNSFVPELSQRDTIAETSVQEDTTTTYFQSAVATTTTNFESAVVAMVTEEKDSKDTETEFKKQVESSGQPVEEKCQAIVGTKRSIFSNINLRDDTGNLDEKQKIEIPPVVDDARESTECELQLEIPNSGTESQKEVITSENPLKEYSIVRSEEQEPLQSESEIGEIGESGYSTRDKEGKKETQEEKDPEVEGIILPEEVGEGVPTADEDENIKEQVVENKSHTDELHTASTRDETNDEVKEQCPEYSVEAAESNEQETKVAEVEEDPTKDRETSITKESKNEVQDKGPETKPEEKSEEKVENKQETQDFYNRSDAATVETATAETSPEEALIGIKVLDGLNICSDETNPETTNTETSELTELSKEVEIEKPLYKLASESPTDDPETVETEMVTIYNQNAHEAEETKIAAEVVYPSKELNTGETDGTQTSPTVIRPDQLPTNYDEYVKEATTSLENPDVDELVRTKLVADTVNEFKDQVIGESSVVQKLDVDDDIEVEDSKTVFHHEHEGGETDAHALSTEKSAECIENPSSKLPLEDEELERTITIVSKKEEEKPMEVEIPENVGQAAPSDEKTSEKICLEKEQTRELGTVDEEKSAANQNLAAEPSEEICSQEEQTEEVRLPKEQAKKLTEVNEESPSSQMLSVEIPDKQVERPYSALPSEKQEQRTATEVENIEDKKAKEVEMAEDEHAEGFGTSKTIPDIHLQEGEQKEIEVSKTDINTADQTLPAGTLEHQLQTPSSASPSDEQQLKTRTIPNEIETEKIEEVNLPENETQDNSYKAESTKEILLQNVEVKFLEADKEDESTDGKAPPEKKLEVQLQTPSSTLPPVEQGQKPTTKVEKIEEEEKSEGNENHQAIVSLKTTEEFSLQEEARDLEGANKNEIAGDKYLQAEKSEESNMPENVSLNDSFVAKVAEEIFLQKEELKDLQTVKEDESTDKEALQEETSDMKLQNAPSPSPTKEGESEIERTGSGESKEQRMVENKSHQVLEFSVKKEEVADLGAAKENECAAENTLLEETSAEAHMPTNEGLIDSFVSNTTNETLLQMKELKDLEAVKDDESAAKPEQSLPEEAPDVQLQTPSSTLSKKEQEQEMTKTEKIEEEILENESQQVPVAPKTTEEFSLQKEEAKNLRAADEAHQLEKSEEANKPKKEGLVDSSIAKAREEAILQKEELKDLEVVKEDENTAEQTRPDETPKMQLRILSSTLGKKKIEAEVLGTPNENEIAADKALQTEKLDEQNMTEKELVVDSSIAQGTEEILLQKEELEDLEAAKEDERTEQAPPEETSDLQLQAPSSTSPQKEKEQETIKIEKLLEEKNEEEKLENKSHQDLVTVETRKVFSQQKEETTDLEVTDDALQAETKEANIPENKDLLDSFVAKETEKKLLEREELKHPESAREDESTVKQVILEEASELQLQTPSSSSASMEQEQKTTTVVKQREGEERKSEDMLETENHQVPVSAKTITEFFLQKEVTDLGAAGEIEGAADDASQTEKSDIANKPEIGVLLNSFITKETEEILFQKEDLTDLESAKEDESKTLARKCAAEQTLTEEPSDMQLQTPPSTITLEGQEQKTKPEVEKIKEEGKKEEGIIENKSDQAAVKTTEGTSLPKAEATDLGVADKVLKEEKSKEANRLKNGSSEDSFITNATEKIILQKEEAMDLGTDKIDESIKKQALPEEMLDIQLEILASVLPPKDQEKETITEVERIEKDKGKEEEILGGESRELSIAVETREELYLQKEQQTYPGPVEEIKSYASQAVIAGQSEKQVQTPASALPSGEQQQGLLSTTKNIEETIPMKEEMVRNEPQEDPFAASTTEKICGHEEEPTELEVATEESRELNISISSIEVSKDIHESPSEVHEEKERTQDGDSKLQVEESEKETNYFASPLESDKTRELPRELEKPSHLEVEPSKKVVEFESSENAEIEENQNGAPTTDLKPKANKSEMTTEANESIQKELSSEKIMEKSEVEETKKESCHEELSTEEYLREKKLSVEAKEISASKELEKLILPGDTVIRNVEEVSTEEKFPDVTKDAANRTDHEDHKDETNFENAMTKDTSAGEEKAETKPNKAESEVERLEDSTETMTSLSDLLQKSIKETSEEAKHESEQEEPISREEETQTKESETTEVGEAKTDEEEEGDESKKADSGSDGPVIVEISRDMENKVVHKKSHGILSGVGSKVKHSISKVKKAITGKSSHPKHQRNEGKEDISPSS